MAIRRMSTSEARENFSELLGSVYHTRQPVIVERKGKPYAVVISPQQFEAFSKKLERAWSSLEQVQERNTDEDPEDVVSNVTNVVEEVRRERFERSRAPEGRR